MSNYIIPIVITSILVQGFSCLYEDKSPRANFQPPHIYLHVNP